MAAITAEKCFNTGGETTPHNNVCLLVTTITAEKCVITGRETSSYNNIFL
jgi:ribosomal protein L13